MFLNVVKEYAVGIGKFFHKFLNFIVNTNKFSLDIFRFRIRLTCFVLGDVQLFNTLLHSLKYRTFNLLWTNFEWRSGTACQCCLAEVDKSVVLLCPVPVCSVIEVQSIATAGTLHKTDKPRVHSLAIGRELALMCFSVLYSQPHVCRNKSLMICDFDEI